MKYGVYCFKLNGKVIYVGKDSLIEQEERFKQHLKPSRRHLSEINEYLQKDWPEWEYEVLVKTQHKWIMNLLERYFIKMYKPKYNKYGTEN